MNFIRKNICFILCAGLAMLASGGWAQAPEDVTETPDASPTATPSASNAQDNNITTTGSKGDAVVRIQLRLRDLGYYAYLSTGVFGAMGAMAVRQLQVNNQIEVDGFVGEKTSETIFSHTVVRNTPQANFSPVNGPGLQGEPELVGQRVSWEEVQTIFKAGDTAKITDFNTGDSFNVRSLGGQNHGEIECVSESDSATMKEQFKSFPNWEKRAVVVTIGEQNIAASLYGQPHSEDSSESGHACLFFSGSRSHVGNLPDTEHDRMVDKAAGAAQ